MKLFWYNLFNLKCWYYKKTGVTLKRILKLVLFSYKHRVFHYQGLCGHLNLVAWSLDEFVTWNKFTGFKEPQHDGGYWWPSTDRESRILFLKDLISKQ